MDPDATWQAIIDHLRKDDYESAQEYAEYLAVWLDKGGFKPYTWSNTPDFEPLFWALYHLGCLVKTQQLEVRE